MRPMILPVLLAASLSAFLGTDVRAEDVGVKASAERIKDLEQKKKDHLMNNIEIFGKSDLPAIYILMPGGSGDEDIKGSIITRDFSRDPFFMQNVDREEFEMKVVLREINGDDKEKDQFLEAQR